MTPEGKVPDSESVGAGEPVATTVNVPAVPAVNVALDALVIDGAVAAALTVNVKLCVAFVPTPFDAVKVIGYVPAVPLAGVPLNTPVEAVNVTPEGSVPDSESVGAGYPVAVTANEPAVPTVNVVLAALVTDAAKLTMRMTLLVAEV